MELFNKNKSLSEIINMWLMSKKCLKVQSKQKYEQLIENYIENDIGFIKNIKGEDFKLYFEYLNENGTSISTQRTLLYIIKASLKMAYNSGVCKYVDFTNVKIRKSNRNIKVLTKDAQKKLEEVLKNNVNIRKVCLLLCLYTGLRIGEVCGLKWEDIDFNNKTLIVKRTIERIKNNNPKIKSKTILIESTPKSETSNRVVPISDFIITLLKDFKGKDENYILSNSTKLYDPRQFRKFFKRIMKKADIDYTNFHALRHTFATRSIESHMDIKTLSEILGHSNVNITLNLYVHPTDEFKKNSIENLVKFMTV